MFSKYMYKDNYYFELQHYRGILIKLVIWEYIYIYYNANPLVVGVINKPLY